MLLFLAICSGGLLGLVMLRMHVDVADEGAVLNKQAFFTHHAAHQVLGLSGSIKLLEEVSDILEVLNWLPCVLVTSISLPLDKIVGLLADLLFVNNPLHCIDVVVRAARVFSALNRGLKLFSGVVRLQ